MDWLIAALIIIVTVVATAVFIYTQQPRDLPETVRLLSQQVRELEAEAAANRGEFRQMEKRIYDAVRLIDKLSDGVKELTSQIVQDGGVPVWELPTDARLLLEMPPKERRRDTEHKLAQHFGEFFDETELVGVCMELGLRYDQLHGSIPQAKAQALVYWAANRNRLDDLAKIGKRERPFLDWSI